MAKLQFKESFTMAVVSLRGNKLRTFLTLLGIIIGVLTIIAVVSVIQGLNNYVYTKMAFYGANDFSVQKFSMIGTSLKDFREQLKRKDLTLVERDLIRANCPSCDLVGASTSTNQTVKYGSRSLKDTEVRGVTHIDHEIGSVVELTAGRHIQSMDETNSRPVCVVGSDIAENVFGGLDPVGRWLKVGGRDFQVVGVGKAKGKILGFSQDNYVRIPITTFMKAYGSRRSISINIHTASQEDMARAQEEVRTVLRSWRKRTYAMPDDFAFATSETFIQFYKTATSGIYFAMIAVSSIALLVGGIVIMNIMFVSVSERRKEIGIRMAVGARRRDILFQFLIESAVISGIGGFIGIVLGFLVARLVSAATSMPSSVEPASVVLAMVMSWSIGLFFGIYPANRAAKLDPVEALRAEL
ncbi:MAG: ABC transporter permease [Acidobacteria bacterium]|jgi:putative ABC transport system permease protein|nr:ABC transporter permease [Acidobacteriota bacterium]